MIIVDPTVSNKYLFRLRSFKIPPETDERKLITPELIPSKIKSIIRSLSKKTAVYYSFKYLAEEDL